MNRSFALSLGSLLAGLASYAEAQEVWVGRYFDNSVSRLNRATGATLGSFSITTPLGMAFGPGGRIYATAETTNQIRRYKPDGTFDGVFASTNLDAPTAITFDASGNAFVANFNNSTIVKFNSAGVYQSTIVASGTGGLNGPDIGMHIGPDGMLYVPSYYSNKVMRFDPSTGAYLGDFVTGIVKPREVLWRGSEMLVVEEGQNRVQRYNSTTGALLGSLIPSGSGGLNGASGMALVGSSLLVTSWRTGSVLKYDATTGAYQGVFANGLGSPVSIFVTPEPASLIGLTAGAGALFVRAKRRKSE